MKNICVADAAPINIALTAANLPQRSQGRNPVSEIAPEAISMASGANNQPLYLATVGSKILTWNILTTMTAITGCGSSRNYCKN